MPRRPRPEAAGLVPSAHRSAPMAQTSGVHAPPQVASDLTNADREFLDWLAAAAVRVYFRDSEEET